MGLGFVLWSIANANYTVEESKMTKLEQLKEAIKSPPPERLAKVEYQSHMLQMMGVSTVCVVLLLKGFWYIIFAFIFTLGVSYSQGMTAYRKYRTILSIVAPEKLEDFEKDISPSRRRSKIITSVMGPLPKWVSIILGVGSSMFIIGAEHSRWILMLTYPVCIFVIYIFMYFFLFYWIAYPFYKKKLENERRLK